MAPIQSHLYRRAGICWMKSRTRLVVGVVLCVMTAIFALPAHADTDAQNMGRMIERMSESAVPDDNSPLPTATTSRVNLEVQWRLWKRVVAEGSPGVSELQALQNDARSLGIASLPTYSLAAVATTRGGRVELDDSQTEQLLDSAHHLAPHLPYAQLELARFRISAAPTAPHRAVAPYIQGVRTGYQWLDTRIGWALKGAIILLIAMGLGLMGFLLAQLLRYFGIAAYDGTRILPRGFSSTQTVILLMAVVLVPGLLLQSPLLAMLLLLFMVIPFQQLNERLVSLVFLAVIAGLPFIDDALGEFVTYPGSDAQRLLHAHYQGCEEECLPWLEEMADGGSEEANFIFATQRFRTASHDEMEALENWLADYLSASHHHQSSWLNLQGAVLIARGKSEEALPILKRAAAADPSSPAPWFNKMRAFQVLGDTSESYEFLEYAIRLDLAVVSRQLQTSRRDPNSFLMILPLSSDHIWSAHRPSADGAPSLIAPFWTAAAGERVIVAHGPWLGLFGIALIFLTLPLYLRRKVSTPCPKCGLARDPTDSDKTNQHRYCLPCYQTFVSGATLDYHARVHSEATLGRRNRLQAFFRRAFSLISPGVGHILGGHAIRGVLTFGALVTGILILNFPMGPWRMPHELFYEHWAGQALVAWILISIAATVGLSGVWRGVEPTSARAASKRRNLR